MLAKAVCQPTLMLNVNPSSRASFAPTGGSVHSANAPPPFSVVRLARTCAVRRRRIRRSGG
ncbi:hypothetical protein F7R14_10145 [Pseudomonas lini]|uniref:Uncharacterized protein n=1 Tax=Pseudomonas lini TaxID=163011 RepID=A0A7V7P6I3_9PSED|nr:hypothetical protein F7R14_10145 [Pseudomonas lini]MDT9677994.1 hypothetical protein [Pseudomonas sp. JV414]